MNNGGMERKITAVQKNKSETFKDEAATAPSVAICVWICEAVSSTPVRDYREMKVFCSPAATWAAKQVLSPDN